MNWLPSYTKLFLGFIVGLLLVVGGVVWQIQHYGPAFKIPGLFGLLLLIISPLLIAFKLFARLDAKS